MGNYSDEVIGLGGETSDSFEDACKRANANTSLVQDGYVKGSVIQTTSKMKGVVESIDGVGTKVQIYTNQFENLINEFEDGVKEIKRINPKFSHEDAEKIMIERAHDTLVKESAELWECMFHDLIAMNLDDLRKGEMGATLTNIIDINSLKGIRGKVFTQSMSLAIETVIGDVDVPMTAGETAILGENQKFLETLGDYVEDRRMLLDLIADGEIAPKAAEKIKSQIKKRRRVLFKRLRKLEFNIGGTAAGIEFDGKKLSEMKSGDKVLAFSEKPTKEGIIGPRSNGITKIRETLHDLAGKGWENLTFEQFLITASIKQGKDLPELPEALKKELSGIKMWKIATGKSTVFNPLVSRELLGGEKKKPIGDISAFAHVTGDPQKKLADSVKDDRFRMDVDMTNVKAPQIVELLQRLGAISDEVAAGMWNMGLPAALICNPGDVKKIIAKAKSKGFALEEIGEISEKDLDDYETKGTIKGIGIGNTDLTMTAEVDRDLPDLPHTYTNTHSGKVRETYEHPKLPGQMILVATDRISTHNIVHSSLIEGKGKALTQISRFWFEIFKNHPETKGLLTHMVEDPVWPDDFPEELKDRSMIVKKVTALPIEAIVRGTLMGSVSNEYNPKTGKLGTGQFVQKGMKKFEKFDEPQFTPSTKDEHDTNIDFAVMHKQFIDILNQNPQWNKTPEGLAEEIREMSLKLFKVAQEEASKRGLYIGDTKFEFGLDENGNLVLIDEVLTPDSSRYITLADFVEGEEPAFHDKQYARNEIERIWKERPRSDKKKYPVIIPGKTIEETQQIYAKMRVMFS